MVEYFKRFKFKEAAFFCFLAFIVLVGLVGIHSLLENYVEKAIKCLVVEPGWYNQFPFVDLVFSFRSTLETIKPVFTAFVGCLFILFWSCCSLLLGWQKYAIRLAGQSYWKRATLSFINWMFRKYKERLVWTLLIFWAYIGFFAAALIFFYHGVIMWKIGLIFKYAPYLFFY